MIYLRKNFFIFVVLIFSIFYLFSAWVADDAYITFRTIENFHNGYGLRWNIIERVQSYTHPLWMINLLIGKYIIDDLYYLSLILGFVYTVLTIYIIYLLSKDNVVNFTLGILILLSSKAALDFSSSGLENSLSYFLIACFFYSILKLKEHSCFYLILSVIFSCMFLNRMDLIIPFFPFALYTFFYQAYQDKKLKKSIIQGIIGFIPVILWSIFALYYYGSFFANSVIAKTNTGLPTTHLQIQGFKYIYGNLIYDPFTSLLIYAALIYSIFSKKHINKLLGLGLALYIFYLLQVGADYMYGRFLTIPFIISLFIIVINLRLNLRILKVALVFGLVLSLYNLYQYTFKDIKSFEISNTNFTDERAFYYPTTSLLLTLQGKNRGISDHFIETRFIFEDPVTQPTALHTMGFNGYIVSKLFPEKHIVDALGLTDAFLAAHPMKYGSWRIGHFPRALNTEYLNSIKYNQNLITLPEDSIVLDQIFLLSRAPLNDSRRLDAIIKWNNGSTFKMAKQGFQHYPHQLLLQQKPDPKMNLWIPNNLNLD
jgi:arabinofuranosyltransferase